MPRDTSNRASSIQRRTFMRLAAAGLSSALVPLSGCVEKIGQVRGTSHWPIPSAPLTPRQSWYFVAIQGAYEADVANYRLKLGGMVDRELAMTVDQLRARFSPIQQVDTLACVGSRPGGGLFSSALFGGVRVADVLDHAGVSSRANMALITGLDGFVAVQDVDVLRRSSSMFALDMGTAADDLSPLTIDNGFPLRLLTPGRYGYIQPKWIDTIELTDQPDHQVLRNSIDYFDGSMMLTSAFSYPRDGFAVSAGATEVLGYAFGDGRDIARVEVRVDDGPWQLADIVGFETDGGTPAHLWSLWRFDWDAQPGQRRLTSRATYADGETQIEGRKFPYAGGSIYTMDVIVTGS